MSFGTNFVIRSLPSVAYLEELATRNLNKRSLRLGAVRDDIYKRYRIKIAFYEL